MLFIQRNIDIETVLMVWNGKINNENNVIINFPKINIYLTLE